MNKVSVDISMSLDGYVTATDMTAAEPLGRGGQRLHDWVNDPAGRELLARAGASLGAVICGRRTYEDSLPWWGADGPTGPAKLPVFVVTHRQRADTGVYRFVPSVGAALSAARETAGDADVTVMGGADVARQFLAAGLAEELQIHLVPVLFGGGIRLFGDLGVDLTPLELIESPSATHLRYRVGLRAHRRPR